MLEYGSAATPPTKRIETEALFYTPGEASTAVLHLEKDTLASPLANALSPGVGSSGTEEADKERDGTDKAEEEEEKDSRPEETERQGNQSDKMDQGKVEFEDSSQIPPSLVVDS